jgi:hypothetical protein
VNCSRLAVSRRSLVASAVSVENKILDLSPQRSQRPRSATETINSVFSVSFVVKSDLTNRRGLDAIRDSRIATRIAAIALSFSRGLRPSTRSGQLHRRGLPLHRLNGANGVSDIEHVAIGNRAGRRQRS